jgi:hypothetical protein
MRGNEILLAQSPIGGGISDNIIIIYFTLHL